MAEARRSALGSVRRRPQVSSDTGLVLGLMAGLGLLFVVFESGQPAGIPPPPAAPLPQTPSGSAGGSTGGGPSATSTTPSGGAGGSTSTTPPAPPTQPVTGAPNPVAACPYGSALVAGVCVSGQTATLTGQAYCDAHLPGWPYVAGVGCVPPAPAPGTVNASTPVSQVTSTAPPPTAGPCACPVRTVWVTGVNQCVPDLGLPCKYGSGQYYDDFTLRCVAC